MMACRAATLFTLLLNYLASSKGALSPPLNPSVELLDFRALARWLPGPGNPKGTRYSLEFIDIEHFSSSSWNQPEDCTNITLTQCYLIFNQRILTEYFVRVGAKWKEERSEWTCLPRSFQPYKYTLLSAPQLSVSADQNSIWISLSHPVQSMMEVRMRFSVDLFQMTDNNTAEKHIAQNITTKSSSFVNLPPGMYCLNASALLTAEGPKSNQNATMCVFLHLDPNEGYVWVFIVAVLPLLSIPAVVGLILIYCYVKPSKNSCIPKAMEIIEGTGMVRILNPEDPRALPISWIFTDDCKSVHQESGEDLSQGYYGGYDGKFKEGLLAQIMDESDQDTPPVRDLYSTAAKLEEDWESPTETECCSDGLTLDTTSFRDAIPPSDQIRNSLDSVLFMYDENMFEEYFEQTESEAETESLRSDAVFGSNYEPRPDPRWMPNL
ncbi:cytokine receptor family member B12 isoform X1 [Hemibagrus wyckioides]|uniref:cytokine receptor family member B12 isoform X1 n=1 Tax=Hemibagrus wyckioides TaxID=337641 RepID=UPI00266CE04B|nr:cytokine receptor family member B12 isoform X1 [Hemibagrus wyckioides]